MTGPRSHACIHLLLVCVLGLAFVVILVVSPVLVLALRLPVHRVDRTHVGDMLPGL